jgi:hypothetical protein
VLIANGIADEPVLNSVNVVREDPRHRGLLYCGTERGVYVSFDDGLHWQALQQNLPRTSVRDLQVHADDLVIATHGRGLWIMDDVAPLRSLVEDASDAVRLLPPATAYRVRPTGFTGTPMPKDEPMAPNPPGGAYIDYALNAPAGVVTVTISDAHGAIVRAFSSTDKQIQPDLTKIEIAPEWISPPQPPAAGPGLHRFVWDLRYAPPPDLASDDSAEEKEHGVWAPPGKYWVELDAGGKSYRQPLTVAPDPRIKLPAIAYARQFSLARDIEHARVQIATALAEAGKIHAGIGERTKGAGSAAAAALSDADQQLLAVCDLQPPKASPDSTGRPPQSIAGLRYLGTAFSDLERAVDFADAAPTPDALQGYARHRALLDRSLASWAAFKTTVLPRLNNQLQSEGGAPIAP